MRYLLVPLILLVLCTPANAVIFISGATTGAGSPAGIAWVQDLAQDTQTADQQVHTYTLTTGKTVTAGNTLIIGAFRRNENDTVASATDSNGNTYTVNHTGPGHGTFDPFGIVSGNIVSALSSGDTISVTWTNASAYNYWGMAIMEFSGLHSSPFDTKVNATATSTALDSGVTGTTAQADELIFGAYAMDADQAITTGEGHTDMSGLAYNGIYGDFSYKVVSSTGTYKSSATTTPAATWRALTVTYKGE